MDYIQNRINLLRISHTLHSPSYYVINYEKSIYSIIDIFKKIILDEGENIPEIFLKEKEFIRIWDVLKNQNDLLDKKFLFDDILVAWLKILNPRNLLNALEQMNITSRVSISAIKNMMRLFDSTIQDKIEEEKNYIRIAESIQEQLIDVEETITFDNEVDANIISIDIEENYFESFELLFLDNIVISETIPFCILNTENTKYKVFFKKDDIKLWYPLFRKWLEDSEITQENTLQFLLYNGGDPQKHFNYIRVEYIFDKSSNNFNSILIHYNERSEITKEHIIKTVRENIKNIKLSNFERGISIKGSFTIKDTKIDENILSDLFFQKPFRNLFYINETQKLFFSKLKKISNHSTKHKLMFFISLFGSNIKVRVLTENSVSFERYQFRGCYKGISSNSTKSTFIVSGASSINDFRFYTSFIRKILSIYLKKQAETIKYYNNFLKLTFQSVSIPTIELHKNVDYTLYGSDGKKDGDVSKIDQLKRVNSELFSSNYTTLAQKGQQPIALSPEDAEEYLKQDKNVIRYPSKLYNIKGYPLSSEDAEKYLKQDKNVINIQPDLTCGSHYYASDNPNLKYIGLKKSSLENRKKQPYVILTYSTKRIEIVGGQEWEIGTIETISWSKGKNIQYPISIYLSRNSGITYEKIGEVINENEKMFTWTVSEPETENAIVKIKSSNDIEDFSGIFEIGKIKKEPKSFLPQRKVKKNSLLIDNPLGWGTIILDQSEIGERKREALDKGAKKSGSKPKKQDVKGDLPSILSNTLKDIISREYTFSRIGSIEGSYNILYSLIKSRATNIAQKHDEELIRKTNKDTYLRNLRKTIANKVSSNVCKQECYDLNKEEIYKRISGDDYIDPSLYYRILEEYFEIHIIVFAYIFKENTGTEEIDIDTPRHRKFIRKSYILKNRPVVVLFRTYRRVFDKSSQLELIIGNKDSITYTYFDIEKKILTILKNNEMQHRLMVESTKSNINNLLTEISKVIPNSNVSIDGYATQTTNYKIVSQYIDSYGKVRALTLVNGDKKISIITDPIQPLALDKEEEPFVNSDILDITSYVKNVRGTLLGVSTRYINNKEFVTGIWFNITSEGISQRFYSMTELYKYSNEQKYQDVPMYERDKMDITIGTSIKNKENYYNHLRNIFVQVLKILYFATKAEISLDDFFKTKTIVKEGHIYNLPYVLDPRIPPYISYNDVVVSIKSIIPTFFDGNLFIFNTDKLKMKLFESMKSMIEYVKSVRSIYKNVVFLPFDHLSKIFVRDENFKKTNIYQRLFHSRSDFIDILNYHVERGSNKPFSKITSMLFKNKYQYFYKTYYIIQNVLSGDLDKAINVPNTWNLYLVNLGYYASSLIPAEQLESIRGAITNTVHSIHEIDRFGQIKDLPENPEDVATRIRILKYKNKNHAAILRVEQNRL